jgi:hypothetical protein
MGQQTTWTKAMSMMMKTLTRSFQTPNGRSDQGKNDHDKSNNHDVVRL